MFSVTCLKVVERVKIISISVAFICPFPYPANVKLSCCLPFADAIKPAAASISDIEMVAAKPAGTRREAAGACEG